VVRYARHALDIDEVRQHLTSGKRPTRLAMTYQDRVSFLLTDTLQLKKISFLDVVFEGRDKGDKDEAFDADAAIATGELSQLIPALIEGLGGEHDFLGSMPVSELVAPDKDVLNLDQPATQAGAEPAPWE
jgi:recombination associated protein RdgC